MRWALRAGRSNNPHLHGEVTSLMVCIRCGVRAIPTYVGRFAGRSKRCIIRRAIPTCVGRFRSVRVHQRLFPSNPHVRGEVCCFLLQQWRGSEQSPRTWGGLNVPAIVSVCDRAIPTYVGRFNAAPTRSIDTSSNPHVCGEVSVAIVKATIRSEQSPRMWGG